MYGSEMGQLVLNVVAGSTTYHLKSWSGNHGSAWYHQRMNAHVHTTGTFKVGTVFVCLI